eukprot:15353421-Ditylum_brightwellii.AAC.1
MGFKGIYRDNGILVFPDRRDRQQIAIWLHVFQKKVNKIVIGALFKFSVELWQSDCQKVTSFATIDEEEE